MLWLNGFLILPALIGLLVIVQIARPKRPPMDESNRINHITLVWLALKAPDEFVYLFRRHERRDGSVWYEEAFPWLRRDVRDNLLEDKGAL